MSSRFVSGGTVDEPVERDDEWLKAQRELEQLRRRKEEEGRQGSGQSLFDTLQANKGWASRCYGAVYLLQADMLVFCCNDQLLSKKRLRSL